MPTQKLLLLVAAAFFLVTEAAGSCFAEGFSRKRLSSDLARGMNMPAVLKAWGAADGKLESETSRREFWSYQGASLVFFEGTLVSWKFDEGLDSAPTHGSHFVVSRDKQGSESPGTHEVASKDTEAILTEILKEVPSSPDSPTSTSTGSSPVANVAPPPNPFASPDMIRKLDPIDIDEVQ